MKSWLPLLLLFTLAVQAGAQETNRISPVILPGAKLEKLAGDFTFTEGPTCDQDGNVFFIATTSPAAIVIDSIHIAQIVD